MKDYQRALRMQLRQLERQRAFLPSLAAAPPGSVLMTVLVAVLEESEKIRRRIGLLDLAPIRPTTARVLEPGLALDLLPPGPLPDDFGWAAPNPRVADALARWAAVIERVTPEAISPAVRELVEGSLQQWQGELMPLSHSWVEDETPGLTGEDRAVARLALMVAKASYQFDESLAQDVLETRLKSPAVTGWRGG